MSLSRRTLVTSGTAAGLAALVGVRPTVATPAPAAGIVAACDPVDPTPVIYSTDINHPGGDPDDHIDLAVMHALGVNVRLLILDRHPHLNTGDGRPPAAQMAHITGHNWPTVDGIPDSLPTLNRAAPTAIVDTLKASTVPVTIVTVGSLRDVAAAYNTDRDLFRAKVGRVVVFAGDATATTYTETNVWLDTYAFLTVMTSGVPIRWVPCFDGGLWTAGTRSSWTQYAQADLFPADLDSRLQRFFSYRLRAVTSDPIAWVDAPVEAADRTALTSGQRNLWCAGLLGPVLGDGIVRNGGTVVGRFDRETIRWNLAGQVDAAGPFEATVDMWRVVEPSGWQQAMLASTVTALRSL